MTSALDGSSRRAAWLSLALCLAGLVLGPSPVHAQSQRSSGSQVVKRGDLVSIFGGDILVPAHVRQRGTVVSVGGTVTIEGEVSQDVVVVLGTLKLSGPVEGNVTAIVSEQTLSGARIDGELVSVMGSIEMRDTSVGGEFVNILSGLDRDALSSPPVVNIVGFGKWVPNLATALFWLRLFRLLAIFVLLLLLAAVVPDRIRLIGEQAPLRFVQAFFVGVLGYLGLLVVGVLLAVTVVGIPFFYLVYYPLKWLGVAGIFYAVGRRLGRGFGREMSLLGAVLLTFAIFVLLTLSPTPLGLLGLPLSVTLRVLFFMLVEVPGIGLVLLTRIGTTRAEERALPDPMVPRPGAAAPPPAAPPASEPPGAPDRAGPPA